MHATCDKRLASRTRCMVAPKRKKKRKGEKEKKEKTQMGEINTFPYCFLHFSSTISSSAAALFLRLLPFFHPKRKKKEREMGTIIAYMAFHSRYQLYRGKEELSEQELGWVSDVFWRNTKLSPVFAWGTTLQTARTDRQTDNTKSYCWAEKNSASGN